MSELFIRCLPGVEPHVEPGGPGYVGHATSRESAFVRAAPGELELATDAFASRPLHVLARAGALWAASSLRRLTREEGLPRGLLPMGIAVALCEPVGRRPSLCASGLSLLPGTTLVWKNGKSRTEVRRAPGPEPGANPEARLLELCRQALARRVEGTSVALALSSGIDSAALLALLAEMGVRVYAYTMADQAGQDEVAAARELARSFGAEHRVIEVAEEELPELAEATIRACECPIYNARAMAKFAFYREVARHERALLSGIGADDLLMGAPQALQLQGGVPAFVAACEPERELGRYLLKSEWAKRLRPQDVRVRGAGDPLLAARNLMLETVLPHSGLPVEMLSATVHGLEVRAPYLDPDLAAFARALPAELLLREGLGKWLLRSAFSRLLPRELCFAPKRARLAAPGGASTRARRDWIAWLDHALSYERLERLEVVDSGRVRRELIQYGKLHSDAPRRLLLDRVLMRLASLTVLQAWWA